MTDSEASASAPSWVDTTESFLHGHLLRLGVSPEKGLDASRVTRQVDYVERMKARWRADGWLGLPAEWMPEHVTLPMHKKHLPQFNMSLLIAPVRNRIKKLERSDILNSHYSSSEIGPDFCLNVHHRSLNNKRQSVEEALCANTEHSKRLISEFLLYNGSEGSAERSISCLLTGAPGCWLSCDPRVELPPTLCAAPLRTACTFALLYNPYASSLPLHRQRDKNICISISHPLLLACMKGPTPWTRGAGGELTVSRKTRLSDMRDYIQPAIHLFLVAWQLQEEHDSHAEIAQLVPEDAVIFGILFDSSKVELIAHIPYWDSRSSESQESNSHPLKYLSYTVDTLDFPAIPSEDDKITQEYIVSRLRVALALLTIQRHVFRLTRFYDSAVLPPCVRKAEDAREELSLGPILDRPQTPSVEDFDDDDDSDSESDIDSHDSHGGNDQKLSDAALQSYVEENSDYLTIIEMWRIRVDEEGIA